MNRRQKKKALKKEVVLFNVDPAGGPDVSVAMNKHGDFICSAIVDGEQKTWIAVKGEVRK